MLWGIIDFRRSAVKFFRDLFRNGAKFHLRQKIQQNLRFGIAQFQIIQREIQRCVGIQFDQPLAQTDLIRVIYQCFAAFILFDFAGAFQQRFQVTIFIDQ